MDFDSSSIFKLSAVNGDVYCRTDDIIKFVEIYPEKINDIIHDTFLLYVAVGFSRIDIIDTLVNANCNTNLTRSNGSTALMEACCGDSPYTRQIVQILLSAGADPRLIDTDLNSAMHLLYHPNTDPEIVYLLYTYGGDPNVINNDLETPLLHILSFDDFNVKIALNLIDITNNINQRNLHGETALFQACCEDWLEIATALLEKGADPYICDEENDDWFDVAGTMCSQLLNKYCKSIYC